MQANAMIARPRRRRLPIDAGEPPVFGLAANGLDRQFNVPAPNRSWAADVTYIWTGEGWLYVAVVLDLVSRRIVGWSMRAEMTADLASRTLSRWRYADAAGRASCCITPIAATNIRASNASG